MDSPAVTFASEFYHLDITARGYGDQLEAAGKAFRTADDFVKRKLFYVDSVIITAVHPKSQTTVCVIMKIGLIE